MIPPEAALLASSPATYSIVAWIGTAVLVAHLWPRLLIRLLGTEEVPDRGLRRAIERLGARLSTGRVEARVRDDPSGKGPAALGAGWPRGTCWLALSSHLLRNAPRAEILAVSAHEIAHVRSGHGLWLAILVLAGAAPLGRLGEPFSGLSPPAVAAIAVANAATAWLLALPALSRRFELEADAAAARLISAGAVASALLRTASGRRCRGAGRHPSPRRRRAALQRLVEDPTAARRARNLGRKARWIASLWCATAVAFALAA